MLISHISLKFATRAFSLKKLIKLVSTRILRHYHSRASLHLLIRSKDITNMSRSHIHRHRAIILVGHDALSIPLAHILLKLRVAHVLASLAITQPPVARHEEIQQRRSDDHIQPRQRRSALLLALVLTIVSLFIFCHKSSRFSYYPTSPRVSR